MKEKENIENAMIPLVMRIDRAMDDVALALSMLSGQQRTTEAEGQITAVLRQLQHLRVGVLSPVVNLRAQIILAATKINELEEQNLALGQRIVKSIGGKK
jgi:hypothetical protein